MNREQIKAFCIDFNWADGGPCYNAPFGHWSNADPKEHVQWYKELGVNTIQSFCVSQNGYAWYKNGIVPEQPGLKFDFMTELVRLGHEEGMRVMGYFNCSSNTRWGLENPDLSYGIDDWHHLPFTDEYLRVLDSTVRDAVAKTGVDGFMIDWLWNPERKTTAGKWIECEKELYAQLVGEAFPGEDALTEEQEVAYGRLAIDRAWQTIRTAAKETKQDCLIWLSCHIMDHPHVVNSKLFEEIDWLMNEHPEPQSVAKVRAMAGEHTQLIQCVCGWDDQHDAQSIMSDPSLGELGFYGFAKPEENSIPLTFAVGEEIPEGVGGNARNIQTMRKVFNQIDAGPEIKGERYV